MAAVSAPAALPQQALLAVGAARGLPSQPAAPQPAPTSAGSCGTLVFAAGTAAACYARRRRNGGTGKSLRSRTHCRAGKEYTRFRALTKIRLRELPDVDSRPTGEVLEEGEIFLITDVRKPVKDTDNAYFKVDGKGGGWAFGRGIAGSWANRQILERLDPPGSIPPGDPRAAQAVPGTGAHTAAAPRAVVSEDDDEDIQAVLPQGPSEVQLATFLSWARQQKKMMIIHPGVSTRGSSLVSSMPISADTPLVGVMPDFVLEDGGEESDEGFAAVLKGAETWYLRLALKLLKAKNDPSGPWGPYSRALASTPPSPLLWNDAQVFELQDASTIKKLQDASDGLSKFPELASEFLKASGLSEEDASAESLLKTGAMALARAVEVGTRHLLLPLIDLVGPCESGAEPACKFVVEGEGDDAVYVLYAARNLAPGTVLDRDAGLSPERLLLGHGRHVPAEREDNRVALTGLLSEGLPGWQVSAIKRSVKLLPAKHDGLKFSFELASGDDAQSSVSESLLHVARVLCCGMEDDLDIYVGEPGEVSVEAGESRGLVGLSGDRRGTVVDHMTKIIKGARGDYATTLDEDIKAFENAKGWCKEAISLRVEKKEIIEDVLRLLEEERDSSGGGGALPFAVTGAR